MNECKPLPVTATAASGSESLPSEIAPDFAAAFAAALAATFVALAAVTATATAAASAGSAAATSNRYRQGAPTPLFPATLVQRRKLN